MDSFSNEPLQPWHVKFSFSVKHLPHQNTVIYNSAKHFVYVFYIPEVQYEVHYNISLLYLDSSDSYKIHWFRDLKTLRLQSTRSTQTLLLSLIYTARPKYYRPWNTNSKIVILLARFSLKWCHCFLDFAKSTARSYQAVYIIQFSSHKSIMVCRVSCTVLPVKGRHLHICTESQTFVWCLMSEC